MKSRVTKNISISAILLWLMGSCLDPYTNPDIASNSNYLVVDGFINVTTQVATVKLTRSIGVSEDEASPIEENAQVWIENDLGQKIFLDEGSPGIYSKESAFNFDRKYTLFITANGQDYHSSAITLSPSSPLDSIVWKANEEDFKVNAFSHDNSPGFKYYRYTYEETYEYKAQIESSIMIKDGVPVFRDWEHQVYKCWTTQPSTTIKLTTTEGKSKNIVSEFEVQKIEIGDKRLWRNYSILVKQQGLDKDAYNYWLQLQKITEGLGGLFDPVPYHFQGNLFSDSNPNEIILGYFSGSEITEQRINVSSTELPEGYFSLPNGICDETPILIEDMAELGDYIGKYVLLTYPIYEGTRVIGYKYADRYCSDCLIQGGTNVRPPFMK